MRELFPHQNRNDGERLTGKKNFLLVLFAVTTFYLPLCFILVLYWRIYQAARKRINKRKIDSPIIKKNRRHDTPKRFSTAKFRFANRKKAMKEEWDSPQNSEAVNIKAISLFDAVINRIDNSNFQKASMRSSTKSESNGNNNSDNMNNNTIDIDDDRDKGSADDVIEITSDEVVHASNSQSNHCESELIQRADHQAENEKAAKVNVYEQVRIRLDGPSLVVIGFLSSLFPLKMARRKEQIAAEREARVQRVLTIITSAFLFCWTPFFLSVLFATIFHFECNILNSIFLWLGYFNSSLNPILYNIFNPEFRSAFKKILLGQNHGKSSFYKRQKL
jgi:cbb3-type cytochrome oxidase subunit 3